MKDGLKPMHPKNSGLTYGIHRQWDVFVTNNINRIIYEQAGLEWCDDNEAVVLDLDVTGLKVEPHKYVS